MEINIPSNFSNYKEEIHLQAKKFKINGGLQLYFIGRSEHKKNYKELYVLYNGFANDIHVNINIFEDEKQIFRMYPNEFLLRAKTAQVALIYTPNTKELKFDHDSYEQEMKTEIEDSLEVLFDRFSIESTLANKKREIVQTDETVSSETIALNDYIIFPSDEQEYHVYNGKYSQYISNSLLSLNEDEQHYSLQIEFRNNHENHNIKLESILIVFEFKNKEKLIRYNDELQLKHKTYKILEIKIDKNEFRDIDIKNSKIKISIK